MALGAEYGFYRGLLREPLRTRDAAQMRPALKRWVIVMVVWQVTVIAACIGYVLVLGPRHGSSSAWVSPAVGAAFGMGLPLQAILMPIVRAFRP